MTIGWIPYGKEKEIGQKFIEITKKYPMDRSLEKNLVQLGVKATKKGYKVFSVAEVKKGKYEEILKRISEIQLTYTQIEGYKYKVKTFLTGIDAMPMVGLTIPAV